jgi:hypothetical protein
MTNTNASDRPRIIARAASPRNGIAIHNVRFAERERRGEPESRANRR